MQVRVQELVQVNFHLQVRKVDLALISMKELDILMKRMAPAMKVITGKDYSARVLVTLDGVMT